ncbi:MAG: outer membrane protein assembly factor BamD [Actinobacteria bacterium]|nr:outer membrane protein assembly factor BamD [Actinomycetota bacterium]
MHWKRSKRSIEIAFLFLVMAVLTLSCNKKTIRPDLPADERFAIAQKMFDKHKYFDAKDQFRIITLSNSGSAIADKAQYYLAECHFNLKEYILSANEYERLIKIYPNSEYIDDAKYKLGLSYFQLSPKYSLDQEYTNKAIKEFQEFLEDYPASPLFPVVEKKLLEARDKLARKLYEAAEQYRKLGLYRSGVIYYTLVLEKYYNSSYAPQSQYWLGECYRHLNQFDKALDSYKTFLKKYPQHSFAKKAESRIKDMTLRVKQKG